MMPLCWTMPVPLPPRGQQRRSPPPLVRRRLLARQRIVPLGPWRRWRPEPFPSPATPAMATWPWWRERDARARSARPACANDPVGARRHPRVGVVLVARAHVRRRRREGFVDVTVRSTSIFVEARDDEHVAETLLLSSEREARQRREPPTHTIDVW